MTTAVSERRLSTIKRSLGILRNGVDVSTVVIYDDDPAVAIPALPDLVSVADTGTNGIDELIAQFDRQQFLEI